jgi:hypothetical protein
MKESEMRSKIASGLVGAVVALFCAWHAFDRSLQAKPEVKSDQLAVGRYQIIPDKDKEGLFFVIDTSTGRTWGYTARNTSSYVWEDYGTPGRAPPLPTP